MADLRPITAADRRAMRDAIRRQVPALDYARCPAGHAQVVLEHGKDARGKCLAARCVTPGRGRRAVYRKPEVARG